MESSESPCHSAVAYTEGVMPPKALQKGGGKKEMFAVKLAPYRGWN